MTERGKGAVIDLSSDLLGYVGKGGNRMADLSKSAAQEIASCIQRVIVEESRLWDGALMSLVGSGVDLNDLSIKSFQGSPGYSELWYQGVPVAAMQIWTEEGIVKMQLKSVSEG